MFRNKKGITDRIKDVLTEYIDKKFEHYRGQIANDLAKGLASLAGLIAIWSLAIICLIFVSFTLALLLGWIFSFWMQSFAYVLSFLIVAVALLGTAFFVLINKEKYIEDPVFKIMSETLRNPETWGLEKKPEPTPKSNTSNTTSTKSTPPPPPNTMDKELLELPPSKEENQN